MHRETFRLVAALLALSAGCACPALNEAYASPRETLATWQAQLCRDDARGEYACLSRSFKQRMGGWQNYRVARAAFLEQEPLTSWLLGRTDLEPYMVGSEPDLAGGTAAIVLEARGHRLDLQFRRESWVRFEFTDGSGAAAYLASPVEALLTSRDEDVWIRLPRALRRLGERSLDVRHVHLESRWKIDDIAGLLPGASEAP